MTIKSHCFRRNAFEEERSGRHCNTVEEERYTSKLGYHGYTEERYTSRLGYHGYTEERYTSRLGYHGYTENDTLLGLVTMVTLRTIHK